MTITRRTSIQSTTALARPAVWSVSGRARKANSYSERKRKDGDEACALLDTTKGKLV
jgi:hypothetical protein